MTNMTNKAMIAVHESDIFSYIWITYLNMKIWSKDMLNDLVAS